MERLLALDTETTGLEISEGHRIIEVAAIEILDREITGSMFPVSYTHLRSPRDRG